jgi:hypothetical protein
MFDLTFNIYVIVFLQYNSDNGTNFIRGKPGAINGAKPRDPQEPDQLGGVKLLAPCPDYGLRRAGSNG